MGGGVRSMSPGGGGGGGGSSPSAGGEGAYYINLINNDFNHYMEMSGHHQLLGQSFLIEMAIYDSSKHLFIFLTVWSKYNIYSGTAMESKSRML